MPIEIKELLIRAFLGGHQDDGNEEDSEEAEKETAAQDSQDAVIVISKMLNQEKER